MPIRYIKHCELTFVKIQKPNHLGECPMKRRPKTIAKTGGGGQGSSGDATLDWQQTQQLSDQVCI